MDKKEWYRINKKRISILNIPGIYDRKEVLNKIAKVSYSMFVDMNYSVNDLDFIPNLNLTDEQLDKWYDYIVQSAKENVLFILGKQKPKEQKGTKRKSLLGGNNK